MIVFVTVILQLASPPATFPVIVQVPAFFAVTLPYVFTEATALLLLLNRTHLPLLAIPARVKESPIFNVARYRERITRAGEAASAVKGAEKQGYKLWTNDEYAKIWATPFNSELLFEIVNLTTDSPGKSSIGYLSTKYNLIATEKYWKDYMKDNSDDVRSQMVSTASSSKPYCLKYPAQGSKSYEDANIPVFRLSELYLNAAEAAIKRNDIPNTRKYLKPIYARTGKDLDAVADEGINLDLVLEQRRIEFWGEGQRFFDLLRNNKKVIREDYLSEVPNEAVEFDWSYYKIVLPVPNHEMEYNENMVQNPEYELH